MISLPWTELSLLYVKERVGHPSAHMPCRVFPRSRGADSHHNYAVTNCSDFGAWLMLSIAFCCNSKVGHLVAKTSQTVKKVLLLTFVDRWCRHRGVSRWEEMPHGNSA